MVPTSKVIRGTGVSVYKPKAIKHTVSHLIVLDPRFSDDNASDVLLSAKCRYVFSNNVPDDEAAGWCNESCGDRCFRHSSDQLFELGQSGLFTAESDGKVIWKIITYVLKTKPSTPASTTGSGVTYQFQAKLIIESKPKDYKVNYFAAIQAKITEPFIRKPAGTPYSEEWPGKRGPITKPLFTKLQFEENNHKCRLDLTYCVSTKAENGEVAMQGPTNAAMKPEGTFPTFVADLLNNPLASDIVLEVDRKKWRLHKCILSIRSPVFAAMFSSDMKEKRQNTIVYKDIDKAAFDVMIKYIYTNDVGDLEEDTAISLLFLSDRFDLPGLKEKCEAILMYRVNTSNCLKFLLKAEQCNALLLSSVAESSVLTNFHIVSKSVEWAKLVETDVNRSLAIMRKM